MIFQFEDEVAVNRLASGIGISFWVLCSSIKLFGDTAVVDMEGNFGFTLDRNALYSDESLQVAADEVSSENLPSTFRDLDVGRMRDIPETMLIAAKIATFVKGRTPTDFANRLLTSADFFSAIMTDTTAIQVNERSIQGFVKISLLSIPIKKISFVANLDVYSLSDSNPYVNRLRTVDLVAGSQGGKLLVFRTSKGDETLRGATIAIKFQPLGRDTLIIGYALLALNEGEMGRVTRSAISRYAPGQIKELVATMVERLRNYRIPSPLIVGTP